MFSRLLDLNTDTTSVWRDGKIIRPVAAAYPTTVFLVLLVLAGFSSRIVYDRFFHPLAKFPGPFIASSTNLWKAYQVIYGNYEGVLLDLHRKYGKIVRIGPNHLDVSEPTVVKTIYGGGRTFLKRYIAQNEESYMFKTD